MGGTCTDQLASWWLSFLFFSSDLDWFLAGGHGPIKCGPDGGEVGGRGGRGGIITIIRYYGVRHLDGAFLGKRFKNSSNY